MSVPYQIRDWLQMAFTEQVDRLNETFLFDRRVNEFYSVFITDYFLTDPETSGTYANSPYSPEELAVLKERMDRQERNDPSILFIPRLSIEERQEMLQQFLDAQGIQDTTLQNIVSAENGRTNLDFDNQLTTELNGKWKQSKRAFVQSKIDTFCNLTGIDLETATLWTDKKMTSITLFDLNDTPKKDLSSTKPWWKFW
jgi:hypothetical protein